MISHLKPNRCISSSRAKRIYLFSKSRNTFFSGNMQEGKWDYSIYSIAVMYVIIPSSPRQENLLTGISFKIYNLPELIRM